MQNYIELYKISTLGSNYLSNNYNIYYFISNLTYYYIKSSIR